MIRLAWLVCILLMTVYEDTQAGEVNHYIEGNLLLNYYDVSGTRVGEIKPFSPGFNVTHGTNITSVHSLVMSYGKDYISGDQGTPNGRVTSITFFLRRYFPKFSTTKWFPFGTMGSGYYRYEQDGMTGSLENAGVIIGGGADYLLIKNWRITVEADYRGFKVNQFGSNETDRFQPFTIQAGIKYFYNSSKY